MHRLATAALIALAAVPVCILVWADVRGDWARGQLTPPDKADRHEVTELRVQWPGYRSFVTRSPGSCVENHLLRVEQHGQVVFEETFYVPSCFVPAAESGFLAGLNADRDPELEIVHCNEGVVEGYVEPGWMGAGVYEHPGASASMAAKEVCATYVDALGSTRDIRCFLVGFVAPAALPLGLLWLFRRRRERAAETRSTPVSF